MSIKYDNNLDKHDFKCLNLKASAHQKNLDIGANLFIGNLDAEVDEKLLYDTFSAFGVILQVPKVSRFIDLYQFWLTFSYI